MSMLMLLCAVVAILCVGVSSVSAHGALSSPAPRTATGYEEGPVDGGSTSNDFVCRHANAGAVPVVTLEAGTTVDLEWSFGAAHVGDCALFLSYDTDATIAREEMTFFKIANFPDCNVDNDVAVTVNLPAWLPAGQAVLRWDWYALHVYPTVEFYVQCIDVTITSDSLTEVSDINSYTISGIYPEDGDQANDKYWDPYTSTVWKMEGPECAPDIIGNCCDTTDYARTGYIGSSCATTGTSSSSSDIVDSDDDTSAADNDEEVTGQEEVCENTVHIVTTSETLSVIADLYEDITWEEICELNALEDCDIVEVGQELLVFECDTEMQLSRAWSPLSPPVAHLRTVLVLTAAVTAWTF